MDVVLMKALQLILSLSILVVLHEGGHFFFSKLFHVKVEKFFMFFDPYFHLFSTRDKWFTRLFPRFKNNETEYGIGWLPLGGYVKIAGMIDESMDTEQMKKPMQPWEFRAKPAWQRLFIMIGGVLVNFLLALFIYAMVLFAWGEDFLSVNKLTMGFQFNDSAKEIGFRDGDILLKADGEALGAFDANIYRSVSEASTVTVLRNGSEVNISMPADMDMLKMLKENPPFLMPYIPSEIDSVLHDSPAYKAGIRKGDRLLAVDGKAIQTWNDFDQIMLRSTERAKADTVALTLTENYMLGVVKTNLMTYYEPEHISYGFWESIPAGAVHGVNVLAGYVSDLKYLFTSDGVKSVGSFGTIGSIFPATWDWQRFWEITAFLSIMLAFMNILPIPALDGGHVLFLIAEIIMRRKPSDKFLERAQMVGMVLLLSLMVLACYNDIVRFLL